ncbi:MAG: hypothetical protein DHS20C12_00890 [Pseudohongiella sp.]|nr:MAG: hypothetical protein DHS20C12_00890 [Pseudohongiella sp.]
MSLCNFKFALVLLRAQTLLLALSMPLWANAAEELANSSSSDDPLSTEQVEDLLIVLESDTARSQFISNLRTLLAVDENEESFSFSFSEALDIDQTSEGVVSKYLSVIDSLGLSESTVGKIIVVLLVVFAIALFIYINNRLAKWFDRKFDGVREKFKLSKDRFQLVFRGQRFAGYIVSGLFLISAIAFVTDPAPGILSEQSTITTLVGYAVVGLLICLFVVLLWESVNAAMDYGMTETSSLNTARVKTLLPVVRNLAFFVILLLSGLVVMSELGIDIMPLLAGAGVLGIAIGFGAQTMVKDFLTGFIIVLEDLVQDGDVVTVGGRTGAVERITLRKIQLRNLDGTVHTVPHSEINVVDNLTKEYSYYLMNVGVAYQEDTDEVIKCLQCIDEDLRNSEEFKNRILDPLEILGVDEFADSAVIIKVRTKTAPHDKWRVGREFNRRLKKLFDENGIEIPFPHRTIYFGEEANSPEKKDRIRSPDKSK